MKSATAPSWQLPPRIASISRTVSSAAAKPASEGRPLCFPRPDAAGDGPRFCLPGCSFMGRPSLD